MKKNNFASLILACIFILLSTCLVFAGDIAIYGDSQNDQEVHQKIVNAVFLSHPAAVFRVGDMVNNGDDPQLWETFRKIEGPLLSGTPYYPVLGNHENESPLYFKNFPQVNSHSWYSVDVEGIHFIVLDSNLSLQPDSEQYNWLVEDLQEVKEGIKFKIALFHHPLFNVGMHVEDEKGLRAVLLPLFEKYGVSVVFSGHEHAYERFVYQGIYFIITGGAGSYLLGQSRESPYLEKFLKVYHFCLLSVIDDSLKVKVVGLDGEIIDEFFIAAPVLTAGLSS